MASIRPTRQARDVDENGTPKPADGADPRWM
jgi:hypothetical protein